MACNGCPTRSEPTTSLQECALCNERVSEALRCSNGRCVGRICGPCLQQLFHPSIPAFCVACESEDYYDPVTGFRGIHNSSQEDPVYGHEFAFGRTFHFEQWLANTQRCPCCREAFPLETYRCFTPGDLTAFDPNDALEVWLRGRVIAAKLGFRYQDNLFTGRTRT